jgi:hypothetical protein
VLEVCVCKNRFSGDVLTEVRAAVCRHEEVLLCSAQCAYFGWVGTLLEHFRPSVFVSMGYGLG